jgi:hypothetical protein
MAYILGTQGFGRLSAGYAVNINDVDVKPGTVAMTAPEAGILPGSLVVFTEQPGVINSVDPLASAESLANKIAGIAVATNVKLDTVFPQSSEEPSWVRGQALGYAVRGEIAVKLTGTAPAPGAPVYYDIANGAFTTASGNNLALANMKFSGNTQGNITVVNILY